MRCYVTILCTFLSVVASSARAQVLINEFTPKGTEWIELVNASDAAVAVTGWTVDDGSPSHADTLDSTWGISVLLGGEYFWHARVNGWDLSNDGEYVVLRDDTGATVDSVAYGTKGGAPIAPSGWSCARRPDGTSSGDCALDWDIDPAPTPGVMNDVPGGVNLGSSLIINEIDPTHLVPDTPDSVELYNPTNEDVSLVGWLISDGDDVDTLSAGVAPAGGYAVLAQGEPGSFTFDFTTNDVCYLWTDGFVRVNQLGWAGESDEYSLQRCPDGAGPHEGYNWASSGGGSTLLDLPATWGSANPVPAPHVVDLELSLLNPSTAVLAWTISPLADSYRIYRTEAWYFSGQESLWVTAAASPCTVTTGIGNPFLDYAYIVKAVGPTGESAPSNPVGEFDGFWDIP
ncbi:lamin tail domain-containing protein [Candidatus Fermentibacteria bacterium]|nr:lamin tail domain-containing protein [Candidatus Fermentibacteria bacterium]